MKNMVERLRGGLRPEARQAAARNLAWLIADKLLRLAAGLVVGALVARYMGPEDFGVFNYAAALTALAMPLAELGLEPVARRKFLNHPEETGHALAAVLGLRLVAFALTGSLIVCYALCGEERKEVGSLLLVFALGLGQSAGMTADIWMQATLRAKTSVWSGWVSLLLGSAAKLILVMLDAKLVAFAWVGVAEIALGIALSWRLAIRAGLPRLIFGGFAMRARELLRESWPVMVSGIMVVLYMRIDVLMLRRLSGDAEVGIYSAAVRLSELGYFVPGALAASLLPWLLRRRQQGAESYAAAIESYYDITAACGYLIFLPTLLLAGVGVSFAYGVAYAGAAEVLRWHAPAMMFVFLGVARSQVLLNEGRQRFGLIATVAGALINIGLNLWLIPGHGATGAAWATVIAYAAAAWASSWLHPGLREDARRQTRALLLPVFGWRYLRRR